MQTRDEFVRERQARWDELDRLLRGPALHKMAPPTISRVAHLYRAVCADLMQARNLGCSADVTEYLDALAGRGHNALYASRPHRLDAAQQLLLRDFPRTVRENWRFVLASTTLFVLPLAIGLAGATDSAEFARAVIPSEYLEGMSEAYSDGFSEGRDAGLDSAMAGFYVYNNVGVAFRCFATGILFGTGSVFFLI